MKKTRYTLTLSSSVAVFTVTYSNGQWLSTIRKKGIINDEQWEKLGLIIPKLEHHIKIITQKYQGRVVYEKEIDPDKKSRYTSFMDAYFNWYANLNGIKPKINAVEGAALKQIIAYLVEIGDAEALTIWLQLLTNWNKLSEFYRKQQQLKQINSNIATLLVQLKDGGSDNNSKARHNATNLRESI